MRAVIQLVIMKRERESEREAGRLREALLEEKGKRRE